MNDFIYLDHNSTSPILPEVAQAIAESHAEQFVNPASQHRPGQTARRKIEQLRLAIAKTLGAQCEGMQTDQLIFTSGGTESNNLAILGLVSHDNESEDDGQVNPKRVLISSIEHPSVFGAAQQLVRSGYEVEKIPVDRKGVVDLAALESLLQQPAELVSIMLANNETGVIQPIQQAAEICRQRNVLFHTDAVQAVAKIPVDFRQLGVDAMSFTAHKFGGPRGIGGLLVRSGITPQPILHGGFQQSAIRPGTEDVALTAGMQRALELFAQDPVQRQQRLAKLRDELQNGLIAEFDDLVVNGDGADRVPHTLNISFPGIDRQSFLLAADMAGLAISTGSACASGSSELSPVLLAMGLEKEVVEGSIRISLGVSTTPEEVAQSVTRIGKIISVFRASK